MKSVMIFALSLLSTVSISPAQCVGTSHAHNQLQWSEPAKIVAPNHVWQVEVNPILNADENKTPVTLVSCRGAQSWFLFTLQREANLYWSSDSRYLLIVDEPLSGTNKLLLFSVEQLITNTPNSLPDALDKAVNEALKRQLGEGVHIQFYLPTYTSWDKKNLLLAVGGESYTVNTGPINSYCYGFIVDSETSTVMNVLSKKELVAKTGRSCRVSP